MSMETYEEILKKADAGRVCVAPLKKVIELNNGYEDIKDREWTRTIIQNKTNGGITNEIRL